MPTIDIRLPWGTLHKMAREFLSDTSFVLLGCLSPEERCQAVPKLLSAASGFQNSGTFLLQVKDPKGTWPDRTNEADQLTALHETALEKEGILFKKRDAELLADEDQLLEILKQFCLDYVSDTVILDISTLPKRYYSLFVKRLMTCESPKNIIVTYSQPEPGGYPSSDIHLAEDILPCAHLPGFAPKPAEDGCTAVFSIGFEKFNMESILVSYRNNKEAKFLLGFPPNGDYFRRQLKILREVMGSLEMAKHVEVVAALDAEQVYLTLDKLNKDSDGLILAPFGPKTHTLGMILFAIKHDRGLIYSQPQSYSPEYSKGIGDSWAYVVKWDGIPCYQRSLLKV